MHIFISAYVLLALASWSALAVPLSGTERDNKNAAPRRHSPSSSILMGRQDQQGSQDLPFFDLGPEISGPDYPPTGPSQDSTMDCDSKSKHHKTNDGQDPATLANENTIPDTSASPPSTSTGPAPAIARRRFHSSMRRGRNDPPSIFERDDAHTTSASGKPTTVGDIITAYLNQGGAARKRAASPRTTRNFN